ncbi:MAG: alpha/beta hydrolase-fold protein [Fimbriimonas sp.]|nr:alpha/beta hydrolase-fold protein [Fimbriimonas sp.]
MAACLACTLATIAVGAASTAHPHIKSAAAIGEVFGDGEKITTVVLQYDKAIDNSRLLAKAFSVKGRTITRIYASRSAARSAHGGSGAFVVIELNPTDRSASIRDGGPGPGGPGPGGPSGPGGGPMQMPVNKINPVQATVAQTGDLVATDGEKIAGQAAYFHTDKAVNRIVDDFQAFTFQDPKNGNRLTYNLFVPKGYDRARKYPLVLFMPDASVTGNDPKLTLIQGLGAVVWGSPGDQAKHPALVLAPQFNTQIASDDFTTPNIIDTIERMVDHVATKYRVDRNRMYTTGQSGGCMMSLALLIKYPNLFAAAMLVAGQWDPKATAALIHKPLWIVVSEGDIKAFPGMNASIAVWEQNGATIAKGRWSAQAPADQQAADVAKMAAQETNLHYTTYIQGTTFANPSSGGMEHMNTWKFAYTIPGIRDWLFRQSR